MTQGKASLYLLCRTFQDMHSQRSCIPVSTTSQRSSCVINFKSGEKITHTIIFLVSSCSNITETTVPLLRAGVNIISEIHQSLNCYNILVPLPISSFLKLSLSTGVSVSLCHFCLLPSLCLLHISFSLVLFMTLSISYPKIYFSLSPYKSSCPS